MIYKAQMTVGKKRRSMWLVGKSRNGYLTGQQQFDAHHKLMRELGTYDEFICTFIYERHHSGRLEIVSAGNYY